MIWAWACFAVAVFYGWLAFVNIERGDLVWIIDLLLVLWFTRLTTRFASPPRTGKKEVQEQNK